MEANWASIPVRVPKEKFAIAVFLGNVVRISTGILGPHSLIVEWLNTFSLFVGECSEVVDFMNGRGTKTADEKEALLERVSHTQFDVEGVFDYCRCALCDGTVRAQLDPNCELLKFVTLATEWVQGVAVREMFEIPKEFLLFDFMPEEQIDALLRRHPVTVELSTENCRTFSSDSNDWNDTHVNSVVESIVMKQKRDANTFGIELYVIPNDRIVEDVGDDETDDTFYG